MTSAATSGLAYRLFNAVRIRKIEIWNLSAFGTSSSNVNAIGTIAVQWISQYSPEVIISDTGTVFRPAHIMTKPPKDSLSSYWSLEGSNESESIFRVSLPQNTIFDIFVDVVFQNNALVDQTPSTVTPTTTVLTPGTIYVPALDGPATNADLLPVDYPTFV
jgi:hypothetical protein